jgi:hypothetical protein
MPIKGLSENRRLPRLGKIHLGVKVKNDKGVEYPKAVDYFVSPPEVQAVFGEKPKELRILIPVEDEEKWCSQYYRCYSKTRGLICKGDGETAIRMVNSETGELVDRESKDVVMKEIACRGKECSDYRVKCKEIMCLQFVLPEVPGLGVWQLDSGSVNSIININSTAELVKRTYGRISMIPLLLTVEPQEVKTPEGKKKTVYVLNLRTRNTMLQMARASRDGIAGLLPEGLEDGAEMPVPDDEIPELIIPENQEPKAQQAKTNGAAQQPKSNGSPQAQKAEEPTPSPVSTNKPRGMSSPSPDSASPQKLTTGQKKAQIWGHLYNLGLKANRSAVETWAQSEVSGFTGMEKCTPAEIDKLHAKAMLESQAGKGKTKQEAEPLFQE